ncbi:MAG: DUF808 domain-containing protein [Actinomycetaceae bacterium]|nr:DUF808 domain-containing protein [Actinomycetaceae bacterium]
MPGGLVALLDDIATLAKVAAASVDDVAAGAAKASAKAVGVVIDDTAVTPQYVQGLTPARELPIIGKIARGSLLNKLFIILPVAFFLTWIAPWSLPILLIIGGSYLCFEGAEKILAKLKLLPHHEGHEDATGAETAEEMEKRMVASATRTDLILSAEIMLIALADLTGSEFTMRVAIMVTVALFMTFLVYGLVAILVKMDDIGAHMAKGGGPSANLGRTIVRVMPGVFRAIGVIGTVAMLWVGGHIVIKSLSDLGWGAIYHGVEHLAHMVEGLGGFAVWTVDTVLSGIIGLIWGAALAWAWTFISRFLPSKKAAH